MTVAVKLAAFAVAITVALGAGYGVGRLVGPFDGGSADSTPVVHDGHEMGSP